jgi:hypothetical protein
MQISRIQEQKIDSSTTCSCSHAHTRTVEHDEQRRAVRRIRAHRAEPTSRLPTNTPLALPEHDLDALAWTRRRVTHLAGVEATGKDLELLVDMINLGDAARLRRLVSNFPREVEHCGTARIILWKHCGVLEGYARGNWWRLNAGIFICT